MATFRIHEDLEKENRVLAAKSAAIVVGSKQQPQQQQQFQQRSTLGVLIPLTNTGRSDVQIAGEKAVSDSFGIFLEITNGHLVLIGLEGS